MARRTLRQGARALRWLGSRVRPGTAPARDDLAGVLPDDRPVIAYILIGLGRQAFHDAVDAARREAAHADDHTPLIVTTSMDFPVLAAAGLPFEHIPDRATWQRHRPDLPWEQFLSSRLGELYAVHRPAQAVVVTGPGAEDLGPLLRRPTASQ